VTESTEADYADLLVGSNVPVAHGRVCGDARTEQRRDGGEIQLRGDGIHIVLGCDDGVGVASVGRLALVGLCVVGPNHALGAVGLRTGFAVFANHASLDRDADTG
jgi:hypothetical protein